MHFCLRFCRLSWFRWPLVLSADLCWVATKVVALDHEWSNFPAASTTCKFLWSPCKTKINRKLWHLKRFVWKHRNSRHSAAPAARWQWKQRTFLWKVSREATSSRSGRGYRAASTSATIWQWKCNRLDKKPWQLKFAGVTHLCSGAMGKRKVSPNFGHDDVCIDESYLADPGNNFTWKTFNQPIDRKINKLCYRFSNLDNVAFDCFEPEIWGQVSGAD